MTDSDLSQAVHELAGSVSLMVTMLVRMAKVRRVMATLAGLALVGILVSVNTTSRSSAAAKQSSADAAQASRDAAQASRDAAQASSDAAGAAHNSQALLDTVNGLLDPRGATQAAAREATLARNDQLYCVVLIANGYRDIGPTCAGTVALLQSRGVLP